MAELYPRAAVLQNFVKDYEFFASATCILPCIVRRWLPQIARRKEGALAQLVERLVRNEKVRSSNLLCSTSRGRGKVPWFSLATDTMINVISSSPARNGPSRKTAKTARLGRSAHDCMAAWRLAQVVLDRPRK